MYKCIHCSKKIYWLYKSGHRNNWRHIEPDAWFCDNTQRNVAKISLVVEENWIAPKEEMINPLDILFTKEELEELQ